VNGFYARMTRIAAAVTGLMGALLFILPHTHLWG